MTTNAMNFSTLVVALALFGLACSLVLATAPRRFFRPMQPGFMVFLVARVAVIVRTAGLLATLLGVLILANQNVDLTIQLVLGLALTALYVLNFACFLRSPEQAVVRYKGYGDALKRNRQDPPATLPPVVPPSLSSLPRKRKSTPSGTPMTINETPGCP